MHTKSTVLKSLMLGLVLLTCAETGQSTSVVAISFSDSSNVDIFYYGLDLRIDPEIQRIEGHVVWGARRTSLHDSFVVELNDRLDVYGMHASRRADPEGFDQAIPYHRVHDADRLVVRFPEWVSEEEPFYLRIDYGGVPVVAETPPWDGGFVWERSEEGVPWVGVTAQMSGASIWWPSKNHPSDRPDSVSLAWTVPDSLIVASNGTLVGKSRVESGWKRWNWRLDHPVSPYQISINAGPFRTYQSYYQTVRNRKLPIHLWLLPEQESRAEWLEEELMRQLEFFERWLGPYPFDDEKLGVVHTPYLGMEHQTILSYGSNFGNDGLFQARLGFDDLLHHELAHEWWGNLVTVRDWRHFWLHEGFATYMQALYAGERSGRSAYRRMMRRIRPLIRSRVPLVPPDPSSTSEMGMDGRSADVYYKGAWILHTLREWVGSERFDPLLKSFLWEGPGSREAGMPPSRTIDSEMWIEWVERHLEEPVRLVLESYLYDATLPHLILEKEESGIYIRWSDSVFCSIPVEIESDRGRETILIPESGLSLPLQSGSELVVDPEGSILMDDPVRM